MSSCTSRVRSDVSANAIFTAREMKQYRRWQNLHTLLKPSEQGFIPTADEYEDFQQWLKRQDSGYFSDLFEDVAEHVKPPTADNPPSAILCRHAMHPITAGQLRKRCPVCTVDMYISYMRALEKALKDAGGRAPSCCMTASPYQESLYDAFVAGKLQALHYLSELELSAEEEAEWSTQHPDWKNEDVRTARKALDLYWSEAGALPQLQPKKSQKTKTVKFTPDTEFDLRRPLDYYRRRSPRYEPGRYALLEADGVDEEDDMVSEDSEDYARAPVLLTSGPSEADANTVSFYDFTQTCGVLTDVIRSAEAVIRKSENTVKQLSILQEMEDEDGEAKDDDDDDSEWELDDETDGSDYIYYEVEEECDFVVFGED